MDSGLPELREVGKRTEHTNFLSCKKCNFKGSALEVKVSEYLSIPFAKLKISDVSPKSSELYQKYRASNRRTVGWMLIFGAILTILMGFFYVGLAGLFLGILIMPSRTEIGIRGLHRAFWNRK